jgi:hypothetical protein
MLYGRYQKASWLFTEEKNSAGDPFGQDMGGKATICWMGFADHGLSGVSSAGKSVLHSDFMQSSPLTQLRVLTVILAAVSCVSVALAIVSASSDTVASGVIFAVEYEIGDGRTGGFTRVDQSAAVPGGNGSWNVDATGKLTRDWLLIERRGMSHPVIEIIPARRLVKVQFGTGGIPETR